MGQNIDLAAIIVVTRRVAGGPDHRGGVSSWAQILRDVRRLLHDTAAVAVTTMLDYYALPNDVPGMSTRPQGNAIERVEAVEAAIDANVGDTRFRSYLALHEFEALLYSDPAACGAYLSSPALSAALSKAIAECGGPEHVNDSPAGAPSKRIRAAHPPYQKVLHGPLIADKIGLASIRGECPHFDSWLSWLESFGS